MRPITPAPIAVLIAATLALGACGSDDDDDPGTDAPPATTVDGEPDPATVSGPAGETSMPGPGVEPGAIVSSSEPGGPTPLVAGFWDASDDGAADGTEYVAITDDGLWTYYALNETVGNCYDREGPFGLTLELEDENEYSLADGADTVLILEADGDRLTFRDGRDGEDRTWERAPEGTSEASLNLVEGGGGLCEAVPADADR